MADNLAQRVRDGRRGNGGGTVAEISPDTALVKSIRDMEPQYKIAMGSIRGATADQLVRDAITLVRHNPDLAKCDQASVLGGLMSFAQLGLRVGTPLGHGWLIPMWSKKAKAMLATVVVGYRGYVHLGYQSEAIGSVAAHTIRQADEWAVEYGTAASIIHRPAYNPEMGGRGEPIGYYCVVQLKTGFPVFHFRTHDEMLDHRDQFAMAREYEWQKINGRWVRGEVKRHPDGRPIIIGPWRDHFEPMAHKTEFLGCARWIPMSPRLELAVAGDGTARLDLNPKNMDDIATGDRPEADVIDGEVVDEPGRETVTVVGGGRAPEPDGEGADAAPAATDPAPGNGAEPVPEAEPSEDPPAPATPDRQALIRRFMAIMHKCGTGGDEACLVVAATLAGVTPVPGSLSLFSTEQITAAVARLAEWSQEGDDGLATRVVAVLPADDDPVWEQVGAARRAHEDAKRPTSRRRKAADKEETGE